MKVLIINTLYFPNHLGGAEISVQILGETLVEKEFAEVSIISSNLYDYKTNISGVNVYYRKIQNLYQPINSKSKKTFIKPIWHLIDSKNFFNSSLLDKLIKQINPDIIHTNNLAGFSPIVWSIAKKNKLKIVHTIRDYYLMCPSTKMYKGEEICEKSCFSCKYYSYPKKVLSQKVDAVVGTSKFVLNKHLNLGYFKNSKCQEVIYNPLDKIPEFQGEKTMDSKPEVIGYIGRINKAKGIELLLEAFCILIKENPNLTLRIAGSGDCDYIDFLKRKYSQTSISFLGPQDSDVFYESIDALVIPSLWEEPFGRILIEASSQKVIIATSCRGGLKEIGEELGNCYIFEPTINNLVTTLNKILKSTSTIISNNLSIQKFSKNSIAKNYHNFYKKVISI